LRPVRVGLISLSRKYKTKKKSFITLTLGIRALQDFNACNLKQLFDGLVCWGECSSLSQARFIPCPLSAAVPCLWVYLNLVTDLFSLWIIYIGENVRDSNICQSPLYLPWPPLGSAARIGSFLFYVMPPKVAKASKEGVILQALLC